MEITRKSLEGPSGVLLCAFVHFYAPQIAIVFTHPEQDLPTLGG